MWKMSWALRYLRLISRKMKKLLPFLSLIILASCGGKGSASLDQTENNFENLSFTIDTVMIDSKGEFLYLSEGLGRSYLTSDGKKIYNLNQKLPRLEVIDLNSLELTETIAMEREGPSGIGTYDFFDGIQILENGEVFIFAWQEIVRLSSDRKSVEKFRFSAANLTGDSLKGDEEIRYEGLISDDGAHFFTFYGKSAEPSSRLGLAIINLEEMNLRKVYLPIFHELKKYEIRTEKEPYAKYPYVYVEPIHLIQFRNDLLVSSSPINELYQVNIESGIYEHFTFTSALTANRVEINYPTEATTGAGTTESVWDRWKQVSFYQMNWDEKTKLFWRLTNKTYMSYDNTYSTETNLTFFDEALNQLGETSLPKNLKTIGRQFIAQGMYWQFLNQNDEIAFVRLKPNFSER